MFYQVETWHVPSWYGCCSTQPLYWLIYKLGQVKNRFLCIMQVCHRKIFWTQALVSWSRVWRVAVSCLTPAPRLTVFMSGKKHVTSSVLILCFPWNRHWGSLRELWRKKREKNTFSVLYSTRRVLCALNIFKAKKLLTWVWWNNISKKKLDLRASNHLRITKMNFFNI